MSKTITRKKSSKPEQMEGKSVRVVMPTHIQALTELYGAALPADLAALFTQSLADPKQGILAREIAVADVGIQHTLTAYASGLPFSPAERKEIGTIANLLQRGISDRDGRKREEALARLRKLADGDGDKRGWGEELRQWLNTRRQLVETEEKRAKLANETIPRQQHYAELSLLLAMLNREVEDKSVVKRVVEEFLKATGRGWMANGSAKMPD